MIILDKCLIDNFLFLESLIVKKRPSLQKVLQINLLLLVCNFIQTCPTHVISIIC